MKSRAFSGRWAELPKRGVKRLDGEGGGVAFARGQAAERGGDLRAGDVGGLFDGESFEQFGEGGAAGERRGAAVGEEARGLDAPLADAEREPQAVAAGGVDLQGVGVRLGQRAGVAWVRQMLF